MTADNVVDIRTHLGGDNRNVVLVPKEDVVELARLRQLEKDVQRTAGEHFAELHHLRLFAAAALPALKKVANHRRLGHKTIAVGAFDEALTLLGMTTNEEQQP